ncbi:MAG: GFA family protein [Sphingopyxis sp.]|uniref:GFA family protein n=1 Tax=Sphingopyxis sp. TaxID=1908224 RepID=UPI002ABA8179|nr:GFA family protein [Sphingopyxis sp.]MDZ3832412.1 GFA family protein [Sphingopyxis sp.]
MGRVASCSCGQLRLTCTGEPVRVSICHCLECQKRTGSIFATQARYRQEDVSIEGSATPWSRLGDSGASATFSFCPACGSTVYWKADAMPEHVMIAVGAFADPSFPAPGVSVYEERQHPWALAAGELAMEHLE